MRLLITLCFSLSLVACVSSGKQSDKTNVDAQIAVHNQTAEDGDKIVCKRIRDTTTRIKRKRCRTNSQIEAEREAAQNSMGELTGSATTSSPQT
ncbi:MAG: hypothetical protein ACI9HA_002517, partial [Dinoroseobacter sp.]